MIARFACLAALCATLAGCSLAPRYERPEMDFPTAWTATSQAQTETLSLDWWKRFGDPVLTSLIEEAFEKNQDLFAAIARIDAARAQLGLAQANLLPNTAANGAAQSGALDGKHVAGPSYSDYTSYRASLNATWELDLWGKLRNANDAAKARLLASEAAYRGTRLTLAGQVAQAYFYILTLDAQLRISQRTLESHLSSLDIYTARFRQGMVPELTIKQTHSVVETARASVFRLQASLEDAEGALAALLDRSPKEILEGRQKRGATLEALPVPPVLPSDLPSNLLERRPDIVAAEQNLIAANADIGSARAAWLPSLSLSAALGTGDLYDLSSLFRSANRFTTYGGNVGMPLFDFGRVLANVRASEAIKRELAAGYEKAVHNAFADVRSALAEQAQAEHIVKSNEQRVRDCEDSLRMATSRYRLGYSSHLDVLDAERTLFSSEIELANARNSRLMSTVRVCLALGGGWEHDAARPF